MKKIVIVFFVLSIAFVGKSYANDQLPDILLLGGDTVYLKSFPMEDLDFELYPFDYGGGVGSPNASCKRGYVATWEVIDYKLYLKSIARVGDPEVTIDPKDFFEKNGRTPEMKEGLIFANWYSASLVYYFSNSTKYVYKPAVRFFWDKVKIKFENGLMTKNIAQEAK